MGSLENGVPFKKGSSFRIERQSYLQRFRSRFSRLLFKKIDYVQWICTILVFLFFLVVFQMCLPGSVIEKSENSMDDAGMDSERLLQYQGLEMNFLGFGEDVKFVPNILEKFGREASAVDVFNKTGRRFGYRKAQLALVFGDLSVDPQQLLMATVATALFEIGYGIQVYSLADGPARHVWMHLGVNVTVIQTCETSENAVDWLSYDGLVVNSLKGKGVISCLLREPFKSIPLIWTIHENSLALRLRNYNASGQIELLIDWKKAFNRSTVVVFPNYALPVMYSTFDAGNFYVIPGSPAEAWEADSYLALHRDTYRMKMGYGNDDVVIAIVGSKFLFSGLWLGHAIILQSLSPLLVDFSSNNDSSAPHLRIVVLSGDLRNNYSMALEATAQKLNYPKGVVAHVAEDTNVDGILEMADIVIYGSFLEEQSFPEILMKAMCFGKPIIAPDISVIKKYVDDRVNGYLFPKENSRILTQIVSELISTGKISPLARNIASIGKNTAKNLLVSETTEGFASLLQIILKLPSEVAPLKIFSEVSSKIKVEWQWHLFRGVTSLRYPNRTFESYLFLDNYEEKWNHSQRYKYNVVSAANDSFIYSIWEEQKYMEITNIRRRREEEELKDRTEQYHGTWEDVYRNAKRADRTKNDLHERDEGELERTGQPLTIYEPYFGEGTWPFLHKRSLYRGIGLSTKGRRPGADDVDAPSRLPLLNGPYYRDVLGEYGAFFAIANRIDRIHKNAWIGFQSWRATARKESLSRTAENALSNAIQSRKYGDTLYFWVRMDTDLRNPSRKGFWSFCDSINAGNCRIVFSETLKRMYGIKNDTEFLPPMPEDGDTWSVMQCWALPTRSFLEFVMFSRMFIDALDAQMFDEHHSSGQCLLSLAKDRHCYSRLLELLVNVWAYHSGRRMVHVNPETGMMQEQHQFKSRRGHMLIKWFTFSLLKSMDEDLAELSDSEDPNGYKRHWLWPLTGEIVWQGVYERERNMRNREKEKRKQKSREKLNRMRSRHRQKVIGKYVKPPPEELDNLNATTLAGNTTLAN